MNVWQNAFLSVKEVRAGGTRGLSGNGKSVDREGAGARGGGGGVEGEDWWDDVSHQAQRVAHVTAASAFASGGGEVTKEKRKHARSMLEAGWGWVGINYERDREGGRERRRGRLVLLTEFTLSSDRPWR